MQPTHFPLPRRFLGPLCAVLAAAALAGCGGGSASLPASTTPVIDAFTANGVAVAFTSASVPVVAAPTGSATALVCTAHDPNHSPLAFTWSGVNGAISTQNNVSTAGNTPTIDGDTLVTCTVTNVRSASASRTVMLRAGTAPIPLSVILSPASGVVARGKTELLTAVVVGGSTPTYHFSIVSGTGTVLQSALNPAQATFTAPTIAESDTVQCYVTDTQGRSNTATSVIVVQ